MKKAVKTLAVITCIAISTSSLNAQLKLPVASAVAADIKKVMADYPNRFGSLLGELITENPQTTEYQCNFKVNGAEESTITHYSSRKKVCSWEAIMLTTESFEKAKQKYRTLYNQLNNLSADVGETRNIRFKGQFEAPAEEKKFTSVLFEAEPSSGSAHKLKMELTLEFHAPMEWKVKVLVYDREREDNERGAERESL